MIYLFLANGFEEIEALCPLDLLRRAGLEVTTVGIGGEMICGSHGITVAADIPEGMYADSNPDMIILPGGMPGAKHLDESRVVDTALKAAVRHGSFIAAICAAPMVLGHRGLLAGKEAICYPGFEGHLTGANISSKRVVRDGNIITAAGMGVALEFGLALVEALKGQDAAKELRRAVIAD
ncbi:MAG: DJ-1/PfpI family protein [Ruminococcaceae bacterium]|nr:DJ-1/PfpI family protein [Oscillospiraceae bacterium]MBQ2773224.1 DJ-1/PfpI family protein [Clostridia bacterium]